MMRSLLRSLPTHGAETAAAVQAVTIPKGVQSPRALPVAAAAASRRTPVPSSPAAAVSLAETSSAERPSTSTRPTADVARERLQLVLRQQRGAKVPVVDLALLQEEVCAVVMRHVDKTDPSDVSVAMRREGVLDVFEMQVTLPMEAAAP